MKLPKRHSTLINDGWVEQEEGPIPGVMVPDDGSVDWVRA